MKTFSLIFVAVALAASLGLAQTNVPLAMDVSGTNSPSVRLHNVDLKLALRLYADAKDKTILQHPQLLKRKFSLTINSTNRTDIVAGFEAMFSMEGIATIPDGKLILVAPNSLTNTITPKSATLPTEPLLPVRAIDFRGAPIMTAMEVYANMANKKIVNMDDYCYSGATIEFQNQTPLSRIELVYCLETLMRWNGVEFVPEGDNTLRWKAVPQR